MPFVREADGTMNYFRNIEAIERATNLTVNNNTELTSLRELEYYSNLKTINLFCYAPNALGYTSTEPRL